MFELFVGTDAVQRRTQGRFEGPQRPARRRPVAAVRVGAAVRLRAVADRIEPVGAGRPSEPAGAHPR
jgi:hypothetical protein